MHWCPSYSRRSAVWSGEAGQTGDGAGSCLHFWSCAGCQVGEEVLLPGLCGCLVCKGLAQFEAPQIEVGLGYLKKIRWNNIFLFYMLSLFSLILDLVEQKHIIVYFLTLILQDSKLAIWLFNCGSTCMFALMVQN